MVERLLEAVERDAQPDELGERVRPARTCRVEPRDRRLPVLPLRVDAAEEDAILEDDVEREGIFAGVSAGAVVHVARRLAAELPEGANVVAVLADGGWKYLSAEFWRAEDVEESMERTLWW